MVSACHSLPVPEVVPKLEGMDELLHLPLDEDCLQKLLAGDADMDADLRAAADKVRLAPVMLHACTRA
jgi:hypothetical protein